MRISLNKLRRMGYEIEIDKDQEHITLYMKNGDGRIAEQSADEIQACLELNDMERDMMYSTIQRQIDQFQLMKAVL